MDISRPATDIVNNAPTSQPPGVKTDSLMEAPKGAGSLKETPKSFRDTEGMQQTDLDSMMGDQPQTKVPKPKKAPQAKELDDEGEDVEENEDDELDEEAEDTEGEDADPGDDEDDDEELEDEDEDSEEEETEEEEHDGSSAAADDEKVHKVKVNGEVQKYSLNDLKTIAASGLHRQKVWRAEKAKLAADETRIGEVKAQLAVANQKITPIWNLIKEKKLDEAFLTLAKESGFNKLGVQRHLIEKFEAVVCARLGLTPEFIRQQKERNAERVRQIDLDEENKFLREELETTRKPKESEDSGVQAAEQKLRDIAYEHGFSKADLTFAFQWYQERGAENVSPENIGELLLNKRMVDRAIDVIAHRRPSLIKNEKFVQRAIQKLKANPGWMNGGELARWVEKKARNQSAESAKSEEQTLTKDISRKALKGKNKARFGNPKSGQRKAMKFSDFGEGESLP